MASIFENDLVLPGVITEIVPDYSDDYDASQFGTTESVTVIGTAFNGPVGKVVPISNPEHAKYIFGESFDLKTRREASLVAEVFDQWDKGCRTIYAIRVSGKDIFKDYQLSVESEFKLRISGIFPSNDNKECYMYYDAQQNSEAGPGVLKIYKPATRTTMVEKKQGVVDTMDSILLSELKLENFGITKNSRLVDVIQIFNDLNSNNVLRMSIVDKNGADVTASSKEIHALSLAAVFPGLYTIGRDKTANDVISVTDVSFIRTEELAPNSEFTDNVWRKLVINTNVENSYPIFAENLNELVAKLSATGVVPDIKGEWLKLKGTLDKIAIKDTVDYEEVDLKPFELYKRLGSGHAKTAKIQKVVKEGSAPGEEKVHYKVVQTSENDANKVVGIMDGIYSMLQNHSTDYTVMSCATAETSIAGKLPKKDDFKKAVGNVITLENDGCRLIEAACKVNESDFAQESIFDLTIKDHEELDKDLILANLLEDKFVRVPVIDEAELVNSFEVNHGQLALVITSAPTGEVIADGEEKKAKKQRTSKQVGNLYAYNQKTKKFEAIREQVLVAGTKLVVEQAGKLVVFAQAEGLSYELETLIADKYLVALSNDMANIYVTTANSVEPLISLGALAGNEIGEDFTISFAEGKIPALPCATSTNKTIVQVISNELVWNSYGDLLEKLAEDKTLSDMFEFTLVNGAMIGEDACSLMTGKGSDKAEATYDINKYIPYTTPDNFARHLAQHCMYTSLKTYPTHGVIGCDRIAGITLDSVANKVNQLLEKDFDLYAKKPNGNNLYLSNNMPYPLGRNISIPFIQYPVATGNGYNYISNGTGYAGMASTLEAERSSTNQPINIRGIMYELSNYQLSKLTSKGIVTCKSTTQGLVITDGITQAPVESEYRRLAVTKTINRVDKVLRGVIEPYIGLQDNLATKNSMNTAIKSALNKLVNVLIAKYDFKIVTDAAAQRMGVIKIAYSIRPINEIKEVRNTVDIQESK